MTAGKTLLPRLRTISPRLFLLVILAAVLISYANTLYSPFTLDDYCSFVDEQKVYVKDFSLASLRQLSETRFGFARLIPLITFAVDHHISRGLTIVPYHLTNILIHLLTTAALFLFLSALLKTGTGRYAVRFFKPAHFCLFVTMLWALNPVQTNVTTYIVQRMAGLAALFYLAALTFYIYLRLAAGPARKIPLFLGFLLSGLCAFLSKENSFTLPLAVILTEFMFISPDRPGRIIRASRWHHWLIAIVVLSLFVPLLSKPWQHYTAGFDDRYYTLGQRLLTETRVVVFYISLLLLPLPARMNLDHDFPISFSLLAPATTICAILLLAGLLLAAIRLYRSYPLLSFGIFLYFLTIIIESSVLPLELVFEHRLYLPSVGFFMAVVSLADRLLARFAPRDRPDIKTIAVLGFVILASLSSLLTTLRNNDWRDFISIYRDCYEKSPRKPRAIANYALAMGRLGRYDEAIKLHEKAIAAGRKNYEEHLNSGNNILICLNKQGKFKEATDRGEEILRTLPDNPNVLSYPKFMYNLGEAYERQGRYKDAFKAYARGLSLYPETNYLYAVQFRLLREAQKDDKARQELGLSGEPGEVFLKMAGVAMMVRQYERAGKYLGRAEELAPEDERIKQFGNRYEEETARNAGQAVKVLITNDPDYKTKTGFRRLMKTIDFILDYYPPLRGAAAGWLLDKAALEAPASPFVPLYRARWHLANGHTGKALAVLERFIRKDPDFVPVLELAGRRYLKQGRKDKAALVFRQVLALYPGCKSWHFYERIIAAAARPDDGAEGPSRPGSAAPKENQKNG